MEQFSDLVGKTLKRVYQSEDGDGDILVFEVEKGCDYKLHHIQDCCERVSIEDICGDLSDLEGSPILSAYESSSDQVPEGYDESRIYENPEWTFYRVAAAKGSVVIRWFGQSDYYSTRVSFSKI